MPNPKSQILNHQSLLPRHTRIRRLGDFSRYMGDWGWGYHARSIRNMFHAVIIEIMMLKSSQSFLVVLARQNAKKALFHGQCRLRADADRIDDMSRRCRASCYLKLPQTTSQKRIFDAGLPADADRTLAPHPVLYTPALAGGARGAGVDDIAQHTVPDLVPPLSWPRSRAPALWGGWGIGDNSAANSLRSPFKEKTLSKSEGFGD